MSVQLTLGAASKLPGHFWRELQSCSRGCPWPWWGLAGGACASSLMRCRYVLVEVGSSSQR